MIKDKFKDRFEELSTGRAYNIDDNYDIVMSKEDWLNALSEIDKEVEKERQELVNALTHIIQISTDPLVSSETYFEILKSYEFLMSKYSKG